LVRTSVSILAACLLFLQPGVNAFEPVWPGGASIAQPRSGLRLADIAAATNLGENSEAVWSDHQTTAAPISDLVRRIPICIVSTQSWAGELGASILFRVQTTGKNAVRIGYFAYWSTERPWGDNTLTHWLIPALAIDAFYSHLLFVLPGVQRLMYGPGDVEGVRIAYRIGQDSRLVPTSIVADGELHREVALDLAEAVDEHGKILLLNDIWSHQLGGRQALSRARTGAHQRCYYHDSIQPLTDEVIADFRLGSSNDPRRAGPAWGTRDDLR
jgi:hypothetical protein